MAESASQPLHPSSINRVVSVITAQAIAASTRFCAVLGQPIRHSASPAMQNAALDALGLDWRYLAFEVPPDQLKSAIEGCQAMRFIGLNLTVPHKLLAVDLVDLLDSSARDWGAVNTILFEARDPSGEWRPLVDFKDTVPSDVRSVGYNTDADAIVQSLEEDLKISLRGLRVLLLGAGGAGRVAAIRFASVGVAAIHLVNRTQTTAEELAEEIRRRFPATHTLTGYPRRGEKVDLVLNATSLGLRSSDALPFDASQFSFQANASAYDMIYRPAETPFLAAAREAGCRVSNGLGMLLHQGAKALEIWTGARAPVGVMRDALKKHIYG